jgi:hypothetical protein
MARSPNRIVALVVGCLLALPALGALAAGAALGIIATQRDADGYFEVTLDPVSTSTVAITTRDLSFAADPASPDWVVDWFDADVRLRVDGADSDTATFVGIGRSADVDRYLAGTAHTRVVELTSGASAVYRDEPGDDEIVAPTDRDFWVAEAAGTDTLELDWEPRGGRWSVVVMNADGSPDVAAEVDVGLRVGVLTTMVVVLLVIGVVLTALAVVLIVVGARRPGRSEPTAAPRPLPPPLPPTAPVAAPSPEPPTGPLPEPSPEPLPEPSTAELQEVHR